MLRQIFVIRIEAVAKQRLKPEPCVGCVIVQKHVDFTRPVLGGQVGFVRPIVQDDAVSWDTAGQHAGAKEADVVRKQDRIENIGNQWSEIGIDVSGNSSKDDCIFWKPTYEPSSVKPETATVRWWSALRSGQ